MKNDNRQMPAYLVGHAHLDPAWQWQWQEGSAEAKATIRSALDRMKEFPKFRFVCSSAVYFQWIQKFSPSMFEEIRQRIKEGRFIIVGGWHIQPDCNLPSGEGYARQSLYAQRYFMENFGVTAKVGYNVDSFGHNLGLPQILKKSGMPYYIYQRPSEAENPMDDKYFFNWFSPDGSSVMTYHLQGRNFLETDFATQEVREEDVVGQIAIQNPIAQRDDIPMLFFYGVCNHGGGPTIRDLKALSAYEEHHPEAEMHYSDLADFFEEVKKSGKILPEHHDDLQHHASGCYAAIASIKKDVRRGEVELTAAENYSVLSHKLCGNPKRNEAFKEAWRNINFLHFHDIMTGCAIPAVYEDTNYIYGAARNTAAVEENDALQTISWAIHTADDVEKGVPLVVFNPNGFAAEELIRVNTHCQGITDSKGNEIPYQYVMFSGEAATTKRKDTIFKAQVPALGYAVYYLKNADRRGHGPYQEFSNEESAVNASLWKNYHNPTGETHATAFGGAVLENEIYRIEFEQYSGYIVSFKDKRTGEELISDRACVPVVIDEYYSDTWGHNHPYYTDVMARFSDAQVSVTENGSLVSTIKIVSRYNDSRLVQYFSLEPGSDRLKVRAFVDWHEKHKMLKLAWPFNLNNPKAYYEMPFGVIERPANKEEEPGHSWIALKDETHGFAIVNNGTYSSSADGNTLYHTIVRSPLYCDHGGYRTSESEYNYTSQGRFDFSYELMPVRDSWSPVIRAARQLNKPLTNIIENWHEGYLTEKTYEGLHISHDNIMLSACKHSEDGKGLVLRLYETDGIKTDVTVSGGLLPVPLTATFTPWSVNTYYLAEDSDTWKEVLITEYDT